MKEYSITNKARSLCNEIALSVNSAILFTEKYINSFDNEDFYTFALNESKIKRYKKEYSDFLELLTEPLKKLEEQISTAASLLIEADREMNTDAILLLQAPFEEYLSFEKNLYNYGNKIKIMFMGSTISISELLDQAKKFKFFLLSLLDKVK